MPPDYVNTIRSVFDYAHSFRNSCFVLHISDKLILSEFCSSLVSDIVLLKRSGIRIIIVTAARNHISATLKGKGIVTAFHHNTRITPTKALPSIEMAAFEVTTRFMNTLVCYNERGVVGNWVKARSIGVREGIDYLETGEVESIYSDLLWRVLESSMIPLIPCMGWSGVGHPYNVSSYQLAHIVSMTMKATKLIFLSSKDPQELAVLKKGMTSEQAQEILNKVGGHTSSVLLEAAIRAVDAGVHRVHILDGSKDGALLVEVFMPEGSGFMVYSDSYRRIRNARVDDLPIIMRIVRPLVEQGKLIHRNEEDMVNLLDYFVVHETDGIIEGCCALREHGNMGEIFSLAVDLFREDNGIGKTLLKYLIKRAWSENLERVFVFTTQAFDWFESLGFKRGEIADIPHQKMEDYKKSGRNSRILILEPNTQRS